MKLVKICLWLTICFVHYLLTGPSLALTNHHHNHPFKLPHDDHAFVRTNRVHRSYFYRHLHIRISHQSDGSWIHTRALYIPAWCLELVGFHSYYVSVSIISIDKTFIVSLNLENLFVPVTSQWELTLAIWQHFGPFVFCVLSRLSPSFPVSFFFLSSLGALSLT